VVKSGGFTVLARGEGGGTPRVVNSLAAGDYFGEIGLLERMPRSATVRASTNAVVYRIGGDAFVDAVSQGPPIPATLMVGMVGRLARTHPSHRVESAT
jgi:CRP-like cAMP-binding protein